MRLRYGASVWLARSSMGIAHPMAERYHLAADPATAHVARQIVRRSAERAHWEGDIDAALLLTSELVTNALVHAGAVRELRLCYGPNCLRVEAEDPAETAPEVRRPTESSTRGRGLVLVEMLASRWGTRPQAGRGKTVWFELCNLPGQSPTDEPHSPSAKRRTRHNHP
jgi:anti-sigma regulatory factor (Ser/Thr protein kinase)